MIASINPATGETLKTFEPLNASQIEEKLARAADVFRTYRRSSFSERTAWMLRAAEILEADKMSFARLMTTEMGKPINGAVGEVEKCAWVCRYYAENAKHHLADQVVETNATQAATYIFNHSVRCWRSCRGIFLSGRFSVSPRRH